MRKPPASRLTEALESHAARIEAAPEAWELIVERIETRDVIRLDDAVEVRSRDQRGRRLGQTVIVAAVVLLLAGLAASLVRLSRSTDIASTELGPSTRPESLPLVGAADDAPRCVTATQPPRRYTLSTTDQSQLVIAQERIGPRNEAVSTVWIGLGDRGHQIVFGPGGLASTPAPADVLATLLSEDSSPLGPAAAALDRIGCGRGPLVLITGGPQLSRVAGDLCDSEARDLVTHLVIVDPMPERVPECLDAFALVRLGADDAQGTDTGQVLRDRVAG